MYLEQGIRTICLDQGIVFRWRDCKFIDQGNMYLDQGIIQIDKELYNGLFKGKGIVYLDWGSGSRISVYMSWSGDYIPICDLCQEPDKQGSSETGIKMPEIGII